MEEKEEDEEEVSPEEGDFSYSTPPLTRLIVTMSDRAPHLGPLSIMTHRPGLDVSVLGDRERERQREREREVDNAIRLVRLQTAFVCLCV